MKVDDFMNKFKDQFLTENEIPDNLMVTIYIV